MDRDRDRDIYRDRGRGRGRAYPPDAERERSRSPIERTDHRDQRDRNIHQRGNDRHDSNRDSHDRRNEDNFRRYSLGGDGSSYSGRASTSRDDQRTSYASSASQSRDDDRRSYQSGAGSNRDDKRTSYGDDSGQSRGGDRGGYRGSADPGREHGGYGAGRVGGRGEYGGGGGGGGGNRLYPSEDRVPQEIHVFTNFFEFLSAPNWKIYGYHVEFDPPIDGKRLRKALLGARKQELFNNSWAFDGQTVYSTQQLPDEVTNITATIVHTNTQVNIKITKVQEIEPMNDDVVDSNNRKIVDIMNIVFKKCLTACNYKEFGRDRAYFNFDTAQQTNIQYVNRAQGFKTAINIYGSKMLMYSEIAHKLISQKSVLEMMQNLRAKNRNNDSLFRESMEKDIPGNRVMTFYNNRIYKIAAIDWNQNPLSTFEMRKHGRISYADYIRNHYQRETQDLGQPLLLAHMKTKDREGNVTTQEIYLVPEHCYLTGPTLTKDITFLQRRELNTIAKMVPTERNDGICKLIKTINNNEQARTELNNWRMQLSNDVVNFKTKVLNPCPIIFNENNERDEENKQKQDFRKGWDHLLKNAKHLRAVDITRWVLFYSVNDESRARDIKHHMCSGLTFRMGINVSPPETIPVHTTRNHERDFVNALVSYLQKETPQLIVCLLPDNSKNCYDAIKKICYVRNAIPNQVICLNTLNKNAMSVMTKVAIQINCKLGGEIWGVDIRYLNIMVIGMDMYHDTALKEKSVAAFVSSINGTEQVNRGAQLNCTKWYSKCKLQNRGSIYFENLTTFMVDALRVYRERNNNKLPTRIFIYRDGVSEGQIEVLRHYEIPQIKEAFETMKQFDPNYNPKYSFIVVNKRGNARLLRLHQNELYNPPIGTVVDREIVLKPGREFYLISQSTNQGTVQPTFYRVIEDTQIGVINPINKQEYKLENIQNLTLRMTQMYYNWPGFIRVPAPCHYAYKLSFLVGNSLHEEPRAGLEKQLYYL